MRFYVQGNIPGSCESRSNEREGERKVAAVAIATPRERDEDDCPPPGEILSHFSLPYKEPERLGWS
jgi:hypothetical protein